MYVFGEISKEIVFTSRGVFAFFRFSHKLRARNLEKYKEQLDVLGQYS